jgi:arylsulfatase A-like enzyme
MPNIKYNTEAVDESFATRSWSSSMGKAAEQAIFVGTRHVCMSSPIYPKKCEAKRTPENGWSIEEAGMAQLDDVVGAVLAHLKDNGLDNNTIVVFTTDNGAENFTWPDGRQTHSQVARAPTSKAASACPAIFVGRVTCPPGMSKTASFPGLDGSPTLVEGAGNPNIVAELLNGKKFGDHIFKAPRWLQSTRSHHRQAYLGPK